MSLFGAIRAAKAPIASVNATFSSSIDGNRQKTKSSRDDGGKKQKTGLSENVMVDVVADGGKEWIKLNS